MRNIKDILLVVLIIAITGIVAYGYWQGRQPQAGAVLLNSENTQRHKDSIRNSSKFYYSIVKRDSTQKGYLLLAPYFLHVDKKFFHSELVIVDMQGRLYYKKELSQPASDFRQWKIGDKIYYSYLSNDFGTMDNAGQFMGKGHMTLLDATLKEIKTVPLYDHGSVKTDNKQGLDLHDHIMLSENHFITISGYEKTVNNIPDSLHPTPGGTDVVACVIQESVDGKVVWQWDATDYPELYAAGKNDYSKKIRHDYTHVNALILDPKDSNLIISFKDLNQVLKINRTTGAIIWRLGGASSDFPLTPAQTFLAQHAVTFIDNGNTLLFVDNGDKAKRPYSRIIEVQLDEKNKKIRSYNITRIPHLFFSHQGNVTKMGENYLVNGGLAQYLILFDPKTDNVLFDLRSKQRIYRAYWVDSIYGLEKQVITSEKLEKDFSMLYL